MRTLATRLAFIATFCFSSIALADPKPFTFVNDCYAPNKGDFEYDQWVTFQAQRGDDRGFKRIEFLNDIEIGLADKIELDLYLGNFSYEDSNSHTGLTYDSSSAVLNYFFTNPATDPLGVAIALGTTFEPHAVTVEATLILQKDVGPWVFGYNLSFETSWSGVFSGDQNDTDGSIENDFGVSYSLTPKWRVGGEATVASQFENWDTYQDTAIYAGPNVGYNGGKLGKSDVSWWVTLTALTQLTDVDDMPDFQVRLAAGFEF